jgi:hypothetical protein
MENNTRENFWNNRFLDKKIIFGTDPAKIAVDCEKLFSKNNVKDILIIGIGYGRNGKYFTEKGYCVDGIEIVIKHLTKLSAARILK